MSRILKQFPIFHKLVTISTAKTRDIKFSQSSQNSQFQPDFQPVSQKITHCPYCQGKNIVKKGTRKKKLETVQLFYCNDCKKVFTPQKVKGKQFPLNVILEVLNFYNTGFTLEESCKFLKTKFGLDVSINTLSNWVKEYESICRYARMRDFGLKLFSPNQVIQSVRLYHRQVFDFLYHRAKIALILQDFKHQKYEPLREFLDIIAVECPHQLFKDGPRISEVKEKFDLSEVIIREKNNFACRIAELVLQAVQDSKLRHQTLERFMLCNDSVTVASEIPVYLNEEDIEYMNRELDFKIPIKVDKPLCGHIDILQVRNGAIHILDYKPEAKKEKPIEQLTLYAIALSRLTGLRLYEFKCAWFDEKSYYEFFPLHIIYKLRKKQKKEGLPQDKLPFGGENDL